MQLQIIRGIGEYQIHRILGERVENLDAIALQDLVEGEVGHGAIILSQDSEAQGSYLYKSLLFLLSILLARFLFLFAFVLFLLFSFA